MLFLESATRALGLGYSVFPVFIFATADGKRTKKPLVPEWKPYQNRKPTVEELKDWGERFPWAGIGLVTGNGLTVLDFDKKGGCDPMEIADAFPWYEPTGWPAYCTTGGGGLHLYAHAPGIKNGQAVASQNGITIDVRGDGGFVVGPGSPVWEDDSRARVIAEYRGHLEPLDGLPELPEEVIKLLNPTTTYKEPGYALMDRLQVIPEGQRHGTGASFSYAFVGAAGATIAATPLARQVFNDTIRERFAGLDPESKEVDDMYQSAIRKLAPTMTDRVVRPIAKKAAAKVLQQMDAQEDALLWGFKVERASRVGDLIILYVTLGEKSYKVKMLAGELLNQDKFRSRFVECTSKVLERIKPKSFEAFLQTFAITESSDMGVELVETVHDELNKRASQVQEALDEEEAVDSVKRRGLARFNNQFIFKLATFRLTSQALKTLKDNVLATVLEDIGCAHGVYKDAGKVWFYTPLV